MSRQVFSWVSLKLEVKNACGGGYKGFFAEIAVTAGERLAIFGGRVFPVVEEISDYARTVTPPSLVYFKALSMKLEITSRIFI